MGKEKRERRKPHKDNPTGLPSVKDFEEVEGFTNEDREKALERVFGEVQSPNIEEKLSGLQTLESMSCNSNMALHIARNGVTKIVGPLLIDHSIPVRSAAASALRHIADNGGQEAYASLIKDDIMTPLSVLFKKYYTEWQPKTAKEKGPVNDETETVIQAITLLWTLGENNETVIKYLNEEDLISVLIKFLDISTYGVEISTVTAQCILSLSEENPAAIEKLCKCKEILTNILNLEVNDSFTNSAILPLKTLAAGLFMNIIKCMDNESMDIINNVMLVLAEVLSNDHKSLLRALTSLLPSNTEEFPSSTKKKIQETRKILGAQQQALEIIANLCTEDEETDESSGLSDSEQEFESEIIQDDSMNDSSLKMVSTLPVELIEIITSRDLIKKVWDKTTVVDDDIQTKLSKNLEGRSVLKQVHILRCRAYLCLNNLISSLDIDSLGGMESTYNMWIKIGSILFKDIDSNDMELLESATSALRATLEKLAEAHANIFEQLQLSDIQPILNGQQQCENAHVRAHLIRILGNLAIIIRNSTNPQNEEIIKHVSTFLLDICKTESEVWVIAEALDAIMDIFAEDETDGLARNIQLLSRLQALVSPFKNKVRQRRKTLGDKVSIVSTVNVNLRRFIKYKEKQIGD